MEENQSSKNNEQTKEGVSGTEYSAPSFSHSEVSVSAVKAGENAPKRRTWLRRVLFLALALLLLAGVFLAGWFGRYFSIDKRMRSLMWAVEKTEEAYYQDIDKDKLYDDMFDVLNNQLDAYSRFYTNAEYEEMLRVDSGQNSGVGLSFVPSNGEGIARVYWVNSNSPAELAGVARGMLVFAYGVAGGELGAEGGVQGVLDFLRRENGAVTLSCGYRADGSDAKNYTFQRREYLSSFAFYRDSESGFAFRGEKELVLTETGEKLVGLSADTAYIRLTEFTGDAAEEMATLLETMKRRGRNNLVLDLRCNGGGYMDILCEIAENLLRNARVVNPTVAVAKYSDGTVDKFRASDNDYYEYFTEQSQVYVLADDSTASASECLIGALVDYGTVPFENIFLHAQTAGTGRSYGKGIMQTHFQNMEGDVMKLTTATIHWPQSDICIHGKGVTPAEGAREIVAPLYAETDEFLTSVLNQIA